MSVMLAYKKGDKVYMATDTAVETNGNVSSETAESGLKIRKSPDGILVGVTGDKNIRQEIFGLLDCFTLDGRGELTKKHITSEIVSRLYFYLLDHDMLEVPDDDSPYMKASVFVAYRDKLFAISSEFYVYRYTTYQVNGKAYDYAAYALANLDDEKDVEEQLADVLRFTAKRNVTVGAPFVTTNTDGKEFRFWEK